MAWTLGKCLQKMAEVTMKKLIPLILLTALVGCAEYSSYYECMQDQVKDYQEVTVFAKEVADGYCREIFPIDYGRLD